MNLSSEILKSPANVTVLINSTATFSCVGNGTGVLWRINSTLFDQNRMMASVGYNFQSTETMHCVTMLNMTVHASAKKNNTEIACCAFNTNLICSNESAYLTVIGKSYNHYDTVISMLVLLISLIYLL